MFLNGQAQNYNYGNITKSLSDHLPKFIIIENGKGDNPVNKTAKTTYRDYNIFDTDSFKIELQSIELTFSTHKINVNLVIEACLRFFNTILDKNVTIKQLTKN